MIPRKPTLLLLAGSLSLTLAGCPGGNPLSTNAGGDAVKIGFIAPVSGVDAAIGEGTLNGARLAFEQINQAGGVNGKKLQLIVKDDTGTATKGAEVAQELVKQGVVAIIGPNWSGVSRQVVDDVTKAAGIPTISPGATSPTLATFDDGGVFFRTIPNDSLQGKAVSRLLQEDGHKTVSVFCRDNAYGNGFADALVGDFKAAGFSVTKVAYPDTDQQDYTKIKTQLIAGGTAVAIIGYTGDTTSIMKDWIASGEQSSLKWYFSESLRDPALARNVNNNARLEAMKGTFPVPSGALLSEFTAAYKARYSKDTSLYDANAYDAAMLVALAMAQGKANTADAIKANLVSVSREGTKQTGFGKDAFADALSKISAGGNLDYDGVSGSVDMDDRGEMKGGNYVVWQWQNGQPVDTAKLFKF